MRDYTIRRARPDLADACALAQVEAATLGDSDRDAAQIQAILGQSGQCVYLAAAGDTCVGFLATFETACERGTRLELDMLGVVEPWRGQGIATALVTRAIADGAARGCSSYRAVVRTDNLASSRVFEHCGLSPRPSLCRLMTRVFAGWAPAPYLPSGWHADYSTTPASDWPVTREQSTLLQGCLGLRLLDAGGTRVAVAALLRVDTIAYSGYWIEYVSAHDPAAAETVFLAVAELAKERHLDEVGMLIPMEDDLWRAASAVGYEHMDDYWQMWK